jgi:hypothetical protein
MTLAGFPPTRLFGGTSLVTTDQRVGIDRDVEPRHRHLGHASGSAEGGRAPERRRRRRRRPRPMVPSDGESAGADLDHISRTESRRFADSNEHVSNSHAVEAADILDRRNPVFEPQHGVPRRDETIAKTDVSPFFPTDGQNSRQDGHAVELPRRDHEDAELVPDVARQRLPLSTPRRPIVRNIPRFQAPRSTERPVGRRDAFVGRAITAGWSKPM